MSMDTSPSNATTLTGRRTRGVRIRVLLGLLVSLASTARLAAQEGGNTRGSGDRAPASSSFNIKGRIYTPVGAPVDEQLRVTLKTFSQGIVQEIFSDSVGNFEFRNVPNNSYEIVVWGTDRFETATERVEVFGRVGRVVFQNVFLLEKEKRKESSRSRGSVVTVGELKAKIPKEAEQSYERGTKLAREKKYEEALPHYRHAIEVCPEFFQALNDLAVQCTRLKRYDEAIELLQKAKTIAPGAPQPLINLAHVYLLREDDAEAFGLLNRAIEIDSSNWLAHLLMGTALYRRDDFHRAQQEFDKALLMGEPPDVAVVYLHVANIHIKQRDLPKAIAQCEKYLKQYPNGPDAAEASEKMNRMRSTMNGEPIKVSDTP